MLAVGKEMNPEGEPIYVVAWHLCDLASQYLILVTTPEHPRQRFYRRTDIRVTRCPQYLLVVTRRIFFPHYHVSTYIYVTSIFKGENYVVLEIIQLEMRKIITGLNIKVL